MTPTGICPGCARVVPLLPPRPVASRSRIMLGWRRRAHAISGDLQQRGSVRCRYPAALAADEYPTTEGTPCI